MTAIGIDLGTTNSLVACFRDGKTELIPNSLGQVLTPSAVSLASDGTMLVGAAAKERLITHPDKSVASFKRWMGSERSTKLGRQSFLPQELSALVLRALKTDAESFLRQQVSDVVISVPAYFNDPQRKATLEAGRLAGLNVKRIVNEPTAAALAYGINEADEGQYLVFDLGGGTFDVSILDKYADVFEIKATTGDPRLGGDDFTEILEDILLTKTGFNESALDDQRKAALRRAAETAKVELSNQLSCTQLVPGPQGSVEVEVTRKEFETASDALLKRLRAPTERAVRDSGISASEFKAIVLVGGATRTPMVRSLVARMFGRLPLVNIDPDTTIARGAAIQAGLLQRSAQLEDIVMTDVCPYTLGVATIDDIKQPHRMIVSPIIERNAIVPISRSISLSTVADNQAAIQLNVYQGESLRPENNVHLGGLEMKVPRAKAGAETVEVRFTYDVNGALLMEAKINSTGKVASKTFAGQSTLSEKELAKSFERLASIKLHPRELMENRALVERAERIYEERKGEDRELIRSAIAEFEAAISVQSLRDPGKVRQEFSSLLDSLERSPFGVN